MFGGVKREIAVGARQQRAATDQVPTRVVVERDRDLDQPLKKPALGVWRRTPGVLEDFVSLEEVSGI